MTEDERADSLEDLAAPSVGFLVTNAMKWAAENKRQFQAFHEAGSPEFAAEHARKAVDWLMQAVALAAGDDLLRASYGNSHTDDRHLGLLQLWVRLGSLQTLFANQDDPASPGSVSALRAELLALSHGDAPALMARLPGVGTSGKPVAAFKIAHAKLRLLVWDRFIGEHCKGMVKLREFRSWIAEGFDTSRRNDWRKEVNSYLGSKNADRALSESYLVQAELPVGFTKDDLRERVALAVANLRDAERHQAG